MICFATPWSAEPPPLIEFCELPGVWPFEGENFMVRVDSVGHIFTHASDALEMFDHALQIYGPQNAQLHWL